MRWCHERGLDLYLYGPKDDPLHRERWRDLYPTDDLEGFAGLVAEDTMRVGFAISPGLSIDAGSADDRAALGAKVDQVLDLGVAVIALLLDDIPVRPGLGPEHAALTTWLFDHLDGRAELILTPTEYAGVRPSPYLDALAAGIPDDVPIGWTGRRVVCAEITVAEARARAEALGGRLPFVWDNYPVNDGLMADRLFLGPLRGREAGLDQVCSGYVANPMVQPHASKLPLASLAAFLAGHDPVGAWLEAAGSLRTFAEACDGERPNELVTAALAPGAPPSALDELEAWLRRRSAMQAPGLEDEVGRGSSRCTPRPARGSARSGCCACSPPIPARRPARQSMALALGLAGVAPLVGDGHGAALLAPPDALARRGGRVALGPGIDRAATPTRSTGSCARCSSDRRPDLPRSGRSASPAGQGSSAARKKSRMCSRRASSISSASGSRSSRPSMKGRSLK